MRDDRERQQDVLEAIERIGRYSSEGRAAFHAGNEDDTGTQAAGLRNVIVHEYFGVDHEIVWRVIERELPSLKERVLRLLAA